MSIVIGKIVTNVIAPFLNSTGKRNPRRASSADSFARSTTGLYQLIVLFLIL